MYYVPISLCTKPPKTVTKRIGVCVVSAYIYRVKQFLLLACIVCPVLQANAQAGLNNVHVLGDEQGYTGYNYSIIYQAPSGKIYTSTYDGEIAIHGNNYSIPLEKISRQPGVNGFFLEINTNEAWYYDSKRIVIILGDSIYRTIQIPGETHLFSRMGAGLIYLIKEKTRIAIYFFDGKSFVIKTYDYSMSLSKEATFQSVFKNGAPFLSTMDGDSLKIYQPDVTSFSFRLLKSYYTGTVIVAGFIDEMNFYMAKMPEYRHFLIVENGIIREKFKKNDDPESLFLIQRQSYPFGIKKLKNGRLQIFNFTEQDNKLNSAIESIDNIHLTSAATTYGSWNASTGNKPVRISKTVYRYPGIFKNNRSHGIFSLRSDDEGRIWAGGYEGGISVIHNDSIIRFPADELHITNGGSWVGNHMYLISEGQPNGLYQINRNGKYNLLTNGFTGFYSLLSADKKYFYLGTGNFEGMWRTKSTSLESGKPDWEKLDSTKGITLFNILTITEDKTGRIWCGHPKRGVSVYNPDNGHAQTWLIEKQETPFGVFSSITDSRGTVWFGSAGQGLWYYDDYTLPANPLSCKKARHPLLNSAKTITSLTIYKEWLVISAYDKMLLLNLDTFYQKKKILVRYLNPDDASFSSFTEQNTSLTSAKDNSVWFSTSDMLYRWDLGSWLKLPTCKVSLDLILKGNENTRSLKPNETSSFKPGFNNLDFELRLLSPDNLPRYMSAILIKDGDSLQYPPPSLQNVYNYSNLENGHYQFHVNVFEADGSVSHYEYRILIRKFLWQQPVFWIIISFLISGIVAYLLLLRKKNQLTAGKLKLKEAEIMAFKSEQEKKLAKLQLVSLSSQFRPHFILNALNTIGAKMDENPDAESVLSRLGESVNIIFNHAKGQKILHTFEEEWKLVLNIIHIHRLMYLKKLEIQVPELNSLSSFMDIRIPMGLLQIPVENALLHGLSNREEGPWKLSVDIQAIEEHLVVVITDNGIGRKKSAGLSNFSKHGTGTKNLGEIIQIINSTSENKISVTYKDGIFNHAGDSFGTSVEIRIPTQLNYDN